MKKQRNRIVSLLLVCFLMLGIAIPVTSNVYAAGSIVKEGDVPIPKAGTKVGKFLVDGQRAFCLEHARTYPSTGAELASQTYGNENVRKALYYGWTGPAQWSGFKNENHGIMITSLVLSYFYDRSSLGGNYSYLDGFDEFIAFVNKQPAPPTHTVKFDKTSISAKWDPETQMQITDSVKVSGSKGDTITFTIPNDVTLVKNEQTEHTGKITLTVGDTFYLKATGATSGTYETGDVGKTFKYAALVFKYKGKVQDIGQIKKLSDPAKGTSLSVKWLELGSLKITKTDEDGDLLDGATFNLRSEDESTGYGGAGKNFTVENGELVIENLITGTYILSELSAPDGYVKSSEEITVGITPGEQKEVSVENVLKPTGKLIINKTDKETDDVIPGVEFTLYAAEEIKDIVTSEVLYQKGAVVATATTNDKGKAIIENLPMGSYTLKETKEAAGYLPNGESVEVSFSKEDNKTKVYTEKVNITNKQKPTGKLVINKTDKETDDVIPGVEFTLYAAEEIKDIVTSEVLYQEGAVVATATTNDKGKATIENIPMGNYILKETKEAPGYLPNGEEVPVSFVFEKDKATKDYAEKIDIKNDKTETEFSKVDATTGKELPGATLQVIDPETNEVFEEWVSTEESHIVKGLTYGKEYILKETINPKTYELQTEVVRFIAGSGEKVVMKDEPIKITGEIDKRQTYFEQNATYMYSIDYRSTANVWADEYNMIDTIDCAIEEYAQVTAVKTPVVYGDYDGKMNVWYQTNFTPKRYSDDADKYNACSTNPENPWNPNNERVQDYTGWKIWKSGVSTLSSETLNVEDLDLEEGEYITGIAFEHGRVEVGFTTRASEWDRENLKSTDDTLNEMPLVHSETFVTDGSTYNYEPAIMYMQVTSKEAAQNLKDFWNSAEINIYRNLGDHPDLEDDDEDKVVQKYPIGSIDMEDFDKLFSDETVQTGDNSDIIVPFALTIAGFALMVMYVLRRKNGGNRNE